MASFHPGVKSLIDRVLKQQSKTERKKNEAQALAELKEIQIDKKLITQKLINNCVNKYATFKNLLQDRMKEKRRLQREEEEEEDQLNEEYHGGVEDDGTRSTNEGDKENINSDDDDDEDEEEELDGDNDDDNSDKSFKLNLDDEDDDDNYKKNKINKKSNKGKGYEMEDEDLFDCDDILNYKGNKNEIPASIPSNQLTSNSSISIKPCKIREFDFDSFDNEDDMTTQRQFRLYIDPSDQQKPKDRLEDIECLSLNFDTGNNSLNKDPSLNDLSLNTTTPKLDVSENNNEEFDELAMLCSGNFKSSDSKKASFGELKSLFEDKIDKEESNASYQSDFIVKK